MRTSSLLAVVFVLLTAAAVNALDLRDVTYDTKNAGKVIFSHKQHLQKTGIKNNCKACHNSVFEMKKKGVHYTMAEMYQGKSCGACHNGNDAFKLQQCAKCHQVKEISYQIKATGVTVFSHKAHLTAYKDCSACHPSIFAAGPNKHVSMAEMEKGKSCGACHKAGGKAFPLSACVKCHPVKELTFATGSAGNVPFSHKIHANIYKCGDCHTKIFGAFRSKTSVTMKEMETGKSCGACHNDKKTDKKVFPLSACGKCHPVKDVKYVIKDAGVIKFSHKSHTGLYTCEKCHPAIFGASKGKHKFSMKEMEAGKSCGACHDGKAAFTVKENCAVCHKIL